MVEGSSVPGGWFTITVLLILLAVAIVVAVRIARRTMRTNRGGDYALFGAHELSAAEHRATAEQYAAEGNWAAAIRHRLRAVARQLEEDGVLDPVPGRTATELARDAGRAVPDLAAELIRAANAFNDVTYGERPGTEPAYRMIADLDDHLRRPALRRSRQLRGARRDRRLGGSPMTERFGRRPDGGAAVAQRRWVVLALVVIVGRRHAEHISDGTTSRRPDGSDLNVSRGRATRWSPCCATTASTSSSPTTSPRSNGPPGPTR